MAVGREPQSDVAPGLHGHAKLYGLVIEVPGQMVLVVRVKDCRVGEGRVWRDMIVAVGQAHQRKHQGTDSIPHRVDF